VTLYVQSGVKITRDKEHLAPIKGFTSQPLDLAEEEQPRDIGKVE
jgi:hypothetical protein